MDRWAKTEVGTIIYYGKLKAVVLPNDPGGWLIVMADSTQYLDEADKIVSTWIWTYDLRGDVIKWESRDADANKLAYVAEYTYNYYDNGLIKWRSPSLDGIPIVYYFYEKPAKIQFYQKQTANKNVFTSQNPLSAGYYLVNGQKLGKISHKNNRNLPLMILVDPTQKQKTKLSLPRK